MQLIRVQSPETGAAYWILFEFGMITKPLRVFRDDEIDDLEKQILEQRPRKKRLDG
jgi:hypothetical protein